MSTPTLSCGHPPTTTEGPGAGCAIDGDGRTLCYACANEHARSELLDRSKPVVAYLSGDERTVTTWSGGVLGYVIRCVPCALTRPSFTHDRRSYRSVRVSDVHGNTWYGRGSAGIAIRLRPCKGDAR